MREAARRPFAQARARHRDVVARAVAERTPPAALPDRAGVPWKLDDRFTACDVDRTTRTGYEGGGVLVPVDLENRVAAAAAALSRG